MNHRTFHISYAIRNADLTTKKLADIRHTSPDIVVLSELMIAEFRKRIAHVNRTEASLVVILNIVELEE